MTASVLNQTHKRFRIMLFIVVMPTFFLALDIAQPKKKDKWISSPSNFFSFFTVKLLFKCHFVA